ncbi:hypothetical protein BDK51DRAFT_2142, partial [Blyttiomyces helicus]
TPLVIDMGMHSLRAGWGCDVTPALQFDNIVAKFRDRKTSRTVVLVGNDVQLHGRLTDLKPAFESGVVVNSEILEYTLDYVFTKLGIDTDAVYHPILMTEPVCNPLHSRRRESR